MAIEFWFEFASTYSYPAAMRIEALAKQAGIEVRWRAFLLGPMFREQGWNDSPFNIYPAKGRYMWRDLERICVRERIGFQRPSVFPRLALQAARIAAQAVDAAWLPAFVRAVYQANFRDNRDIADSTVLAGILSALDLDAEKILAAAQTDGAKDALRNASEAARQLGIFGAPTFVVGDEMFWGNDRLQDALDWHRAHGAN
jgi:2-hydroxychromene-2-carboxylate isomerase